MRLRAKNVEVQYGVKLVCLKDSKVGCKVWKAYKDQAEVAWGYNLEDIVRDLEVA